MDTVNAVILIKTKHNVGLPLSILNLTWDDLYQNSN